MPGHSYSWGTGYPDVLPANFADNPNCSVTQLQYNVVANWMKENNFTTYNQATEYFSNKIFNKLAENQVNPVVWEETFLVMQDKLPKNTVVQIYHSLDTLKQALAMGYRGLASNAWAWYLDLPYTTWETFYLNEIAANVTDPEQLKLLLGGEVCMWSEEMDLGDMENVTLWIVELPQLN
eukprot:gene10872-12668_t